MSHTEEKFSEEADGGMQIPPHTIVVEIRDPAERLDRTNSHTQSNGIFLFSPNDFFIARDIAVVSAAAVQQTLALHDR